MCRNRPERESVVVALVVEVEVEEITVDSDGVVAGGGQGTKIRVKRASTNPKKEEEGKEKTLVTKTTMVHHFGRNSRKEWVDFLIGLQRLMVDCRDIGLEASKITYNS